LYKWIPLDILGVRKSNPMKRSVLFFVLLVYFLSLNANTYYSVNSVSPNLTSSWHINRNGTGASPANFTSGDIFVIQTNHSLATTANWTISGTNSKLLIETGAILLGNNKITVPGFQIDGTGTYIHNVNIIRFLEPPPGLLQRQAQLN
jgi:hypothetical protein